MQRISMTDRVLGLLGFCPRRENTVLGTKLLVVLSLRRRGLKQVFSCARLRSTARAEEFCPMLPYSMGTKPVDFPSSRLGRFE
jgi:hypothetical protein